MNTLNFGQAIEAAKEGKKVAIIMRGYGGKRKKQARNTVGKEIS